MGPATGAWKESEWLEIQGARTDRLQETVSNGGDLPTA
jgi:hypothetical protein